MINAKQAKMLRRLAFRICVAEGINPAPIRYLRAKVRGYRIHDPRSLRGVYKRLKAHYNQKRLALGVRHA